MKLSSRPNFRAGIALVVVMVAIFVLASMAAIFSYSMKVETKLAANGNADEQLLWLGRSGVEYARWILAQEASIASEPYDSLNQIWAGGPGGPGETNSVLANISLNNYPVGNGTVSLKIIDLERFANINTATAPELQQALTLMGADADSISVVSDSILDWVQPGDSPRIAGAKNDYYQGLNPPYYCKEAPMDDLSELMLVKGVTPAMYDPETFGNASSPFHHQLGFGGTPDEQPDYPFGLKDLFTAISSGRININTADTNVLQLIPGVDGAAAAAIVQQRAGPDGVDGTEDDTPFQNINQLTTAGVSPQVIQQAARYCTVRSSTFEVQVTARLGDYTREYDAILFRNSGTDIQILSFYWK
ncbi:MAG TPA: general secretion pathway protein GspK [Candidatus Aquilonibacter sp.]|nr:general secretion pathway protein GspK [Candidatus Aquilonibacter sp.]